MEKAELIQRIHSEIIKIEPEAEIYLFGSRARGDYRADSDWDVLIISPKENITFDYEIEIREPIFNLEIETGEVISLMIYSKNDWQNKKAISPLFHNVAKEGLKI